jgi:hypothetical protein
VGISHPGKLIQVSQSVCRQSRDAADLKHDATSPSESDQQRQGVWQDRKMLTPVAKFRLRRPVLIGAKGLRPHGASPDDDRTAKAGKLLRSELP